MNVLLVCYDISRNGGCERVALNLFGELSKTCNVRIVSLFKEYASFPEEKSHVEFLSHRKGSFKKDFLAIYKKLSHVSDDFHSDLIMAVGINCSLYVCLVGKRRGVKTIVCEHSNLLNSVYNTRKQLIKRRFVLALCDRLVTLTQEDMIEYGKKYPKYLSKLEYIYNWIDITEDQVCHPYTVDSKRIITICRIDRVKRIEDSIMVFSDLYKEFPEWVWEIYGDGDEKYLEELKEIIRINGVEHFYFKGYCKDPSVVYKNAAIYSCTSMFEGLPISLLEAKAWHIPIISYNCKTGPGEIIEDGINGVLIPDGDRKEFKAQLERLLKDDCRRIELSKNAYTNMEKFRKEHIIDRWMALFKKTIRQNGGKNESVNS